MSPDIAKFLLCWLLNWDSQQGRDLATSGRNKKISIWPILYLYHEESLVSSNLNSKQLGFHGVRPNQHTCQLHKWIQFSMNMEHHSIRHLCEHQRSPHHFRDHLVPLNKRLTQSSSLRILFIFILIIFINFILTQKPVLNFPPNFELAYLIEMILSA